MHGNITAAASFAAPRNRLASTIVIRKGPAHSPSVSFARDRPTTYRFVAAATRYPSMVSSCTAHSIGNVVSLPANGTTALSTSCTAGAGRVTVFIGVSTTIVDWSGPG
jgi:hypothetical protein